VEIGLKLVEEVGCQAVVEEQVVRPVSISLQVRESTRKWFSPRESPTPASEL
jgi:hypothetical protein